MRDPRALMSRLKMNSLTSLRSHSRRDRGGDLRDDDRYSYDSEGASFRPAEQ